MKYIKGIDVLRACAVLCVIIAHWFPFSGTYSLWSTLRFFFIPTGAFGVILFFVISGYLITSILFDAKQKDVHPFAILKNFYARRTLRIFPVYYLLLILLIVLNGPSGLHEGYLKYYATYTTNFLFIKLGHFTYLGHLWSLAVEEQFYLVWPWLILFVPNKKLKYIVWVIVLSVPIIKYICYFVYDYDSIITVNLFPFSTYDAFGVGTLFAFYKNVEVDNSFSKGVRKSFPWLVAIYFVGLLIYYPPIAAKLPRLMERITEPIYSLSWRFLCIGIIDFVINNKSLTLKKYLLENKYLLWIGKISYGMYLFHMVLPFFYKKYLLPIFFSTPYMGVLARSVLAGNLIMFAFLLLITSIFFKYFESPIMKLKNRFKYNN